MTNVIDQSSRNVSHPIDIMLKYTEAWNSNDYQQVVDLFLPEGTYFGPTYTSPISVKAFGDMVKDFMNGFPDMVYTNISLSTIGDSVGSLHYMFSGTHTGDFSGIPASASEICFPGASLFTLKDGKLISVLDAFDAATFIDLIQNGGNDFKKFRKTLGILASKGK